MAPRYELTGCRFGRWTVVAASPARHRGQVAWLCRCTCGTEKVLAGFLLRSGTSKSCGCYRIDRGREHGAKIQRRHGEGSNGKESAEYRTWAQMLTRCQNPRHNQFYIYGGRGIKVCARWQAFENFLADMGRRPSRELSIDRIDVNGNYEPGNCRWATYTEQARNMRSNRRIAVRGDTKTIAEWCEVVGLRRETFYQRLRRGMTEEEAILTPRMLPGRKPHRSS